ACSFPCVRGSSALNSRDAVKRRPGGPGQGTDLRSSLAARYTPPVHSTRGTPMLDVRLVLPGLVCVLLLLPALAAVAPPGPARPVVDRQGDALPPGATARLGTVRLRGLTASLHFSADGKTLVGVEGRSVRVWDSSSGQLLATRRLGGPGRAGRW